MLFAWFVVVSGLSYACRGLFERHKLLFSFHMCAKILETAGKLNMDEYNFFLRGGIVKKHLIAFSVIQILRFTKNFSL